MDSCQAILPDTLRVNANPFQTDLCRDPEDRDVKNKSKRFHLGEKQSEKCGVCHPWLLDSGTPCRNDGYIACVDSYA